MGKAHFYNAKIEWTGNNGTGTNNYRGYERSHIITMKDKPEILGSSDPAFRGDKTKYSPEDLFVTTLSTCHMLWYLHLCAEAGIIVTDYIDNVIGTMIENPSGDGRFTEVILNPVVTVQEDSMIDKANELHKKAHELCFIANSVNFPVHYRPKAIVIQK